MNKQTVRIYIEYVALFYSLIYPEGENNAQLYSCERKLFKKDRDVLEGFLSEYNQQEILTEFKNATNSLSADKLTIDQILPLFRLSFERWIKKEGITGFKYEYNDSNAEQIIIFKLSVPPLKTLVRKLSGEDSVKKRKSIVFSHVKKKKPVMKKGKVDKQKQKHTFFKILYTGMKN